MSPPPVYLGLALLLVGACQSSKPAPDFLESERARAMTWLSLHGARSVGHPARSDSEWSRQIEWPIVVDQRWTGFVARLSGTRPPGYDRCSFGTRTGACVKTMSGDSVSLHLRLTTSGRTTRIAALLRARTF